MIYVLLVTHPFEFSEVVGLYSEKSLAENAKKACLNQDDSGGYDEYEILEKELDLNE